MAILGPFFSEVVAPVEFSAGLFNSDRRVLCLDELQVGIRAFESCRWVDSSSQRISPELKKVKQGG